MTSLSAPVLSSCACHSHSLSRRRLLGLAGSAIGAALLPRFAWAAGTTDSLLLSCMDYRLMGKLAAYMDQRGLTANYDHVILAGGSIGVATNKQPDWRNTFWQHLEIARDLHHIKTVMIMDHRDCGAYRVFLGKNLTGEVELGAHRRMLHHAAELISQHHRELGTELLFMELDGSVKTL